ncbi:MAG: geranylgeranylglycerol-phosphate geranylgeranyltransferase [Chitinophagaceae bacterium]|nr:geranylgeranylglycerol-phosphate geranylgeranyltransferase [Chitinophagaceae bacterium]
MQKLRAILTLIRFPNLLFILLTQVLVYIFIVLPTTDRLCQAPTLEGLQVIGIILSTVMIAAAGYMINDYFDIGIDNINKPEKVTIEKIFKRRTIIIWHILLNVLALAIVSYLSYHWLKLRYIGIQLLCIFLLVVYSTTFKRKLIIGNVIIAILTSLTLLSIVVYEPKIHLVDFSIFQIRFLWNYIAFAFLITLIREIVKDIEDVKGDTTLQCRTIPLVWGINRAKQFIYALSVALMLLFVYMAVDFFDTHIILLSCLGIGVLLPLVVIIISVYRATTSKDFHRISTFIKIVTLLGILSMMFI